jgi:hypothetical protein
VNARHVLVLILISATVAVVLLVRHDNAGTLAEQQSPSITTSRTTADRQIVTTAPASARTSTSPAAAGPFPHPLTDADLQAMLDQDSDLDAAHRLQLSRLGAQIIYADLTTICVIELARAWPELWPAGPPTRAAVRDFRLNAISARSGRGGDFLITAIYSGTDTRSGAPIARATSTLRAALGPDGYRPLAP